MNRRAFTLIELAVVMAILAVIAGAVALNVRAPIDRARARDVVAQIGHFDAMTRTMVRQLDKAAQLVVDISAQTLGRTDVATGESIGRALQLPRGAQITGVRLKDEVIRHDTVAITCSRHGLTPTYALELSFTDGRRKWLLLAGLTGQLMEFDDAEALERIFATFVDRHDAGRGRRRHGDTGLAAERPGAGP